METKSSCQLTAFLLLLVNLYFVRYQALLEKRRVCRLYCIDIIADQ